MNVPAMASKQKGKEQVTVLNEIGYLQIRVQTRGAISWLQDVII